MELEWGPAPQYLKEMTGLVQTARVVGREYGIFHERYGSERWSLRMRPLGSDGQPVDGWGLPLRTRKTKRELLEGFVPAAADPARRNGPMLAR